MLGWVATKYDKDLWVREVNADTYEYLGTHTDDIMCVSPRAKHSMEEINAVFPMKGIAPPSYHLGVDYRKVDGAWYLGSQTHCQEALVKVAAALNCRLIKTDRGTHQVEGLKGYDTPMGEDAKPELDMSEPMSARQHRTFQQLMGIAQWLITIGRFDLNFAVISLARFNAAPRVGHLVYAKRIFGYLMKYPSLWTKIDLAEDPKRNTLTKPVDKDNDWATLYSESEIDEDCSVYPRPRGKMLIPVVYFDSNFAHDETTRKSITGCFTQIGMTPVGSLCKRQGCVTTSTYGAEMISCKVGVEEAIDIRAFLRSLGVPIPGKTQVIGDNLGQLQSCANPGAEMKKKALSTSFHFIRENCAVGRIELLKIGTLLNYADFNTKALGRKHFWDFHGNLFYTLAWGRNEAQHASRPRLPGSRRAGEEW